MHKIVTVVVQLKPDSTVVSLEKPWTSSVRVLPSGGDLSTASTATSTCVLRFLTPIVPRVDSEVVHHTVNVGRPNLAVVQIKLHVCVNQ